MRRAALVLGAATAVIAWMSEILVGAIQPTARSLGLSSGFVGVFVVAILGNAAEHATAISAAMKNRMDLSLSIAIGSSVQVAVFVAPVLMLVSLVLGPAPMDLAFPAGLVLVVLLSVLITGPGRERRTIGLVERCSAVGGLCRPRPDLLLRAGCSAALTGHARRRNRSDHACPDWRGRPTQEINPPRSYAHAAPRRDHTRMPGSRLIPHQGLIPENAIESWDTRNCNPVDLPRSRRR